LRRFICCSLPRWILTLGGLALAAVAVAAYPLGLDNNPEMGPRRIAHLALGIGIALLAQAGAILKKLGIPTAARQAPEAVEERLATEVPGPPRLMGLRLWLPVALISLAILAFYAWLVTGGNPTHLPVTTLYYDMLAEAFVSGQTHLKVVPDPRRTN
jgi:hypothetical protein